MPHDLSSDSENFCGILRLRHDTAARVVQDTNRVPNKLDWSNLEEAICLSGNDNDSRCTRFQRLILEKLFNISKESADDFITDGGDDCGIDCFVIDESNAQIHLVSTKTIEAYENAHKNFPGAEIVKLISFVKDFVSRKDALLARCNPILRAKIVKLGAHGQWHCFHDLRSCLLQSERSGRS